MFLHGVRPPPPPPPPSPPPPPENLKCSGNITRDGDIQWGSHDSAWSEEESVCTSGHSITPWWELAGVMFPSLLIGAGDSEYLQKTAAVSPRNKNGLSPFTLRTIRRCQCFCVHCERGTSVCWQSDHILHGHSQELNNSSSSVLPLITSVVQQRHYLLTVNRPKHIDRSSLFTWRVVWSVDPQCRRGRQRREGLVGYRRQK